MIWYYRKGRKVEEDLGTYQEILRWSGEIGERIWNGCVIFFVPVGVSLFGQQVHTHRRQQSVSLFRANSGGFTKSMTLVGPGLLHQAL